MGSLAGQIIRSTIVLSAAAAIGVQLWLGSHAWQALIWIGLATGLLAVAAGRRNSLGGYWLVLVPLYIYPIAVYQYAGFQPAFGGVVLAGVLGLGIGAQPSWRWSLPRPWALALSFGALAIALTWPVIAFREFDFAFDQLFTTRSITWGGIPAHVQIAFVTGVAGAHLAGILFLDGMVGRFRDDLPGFRRLVLAPLAVSAAVSSVVALYQMTADITFANEGMFASLGRASGLMRDANAFGSIAAIWAIACVWLFIEHPSRGRVALSVVSMALFSAGVWATGSRTALLAFVVALPFLALALVRRFRSQLSARGVAAGVGGAIVVLGLVAAVASRSDAVGPLARFSELESAGGSVSEIVKELRDRGGYGTSARNIIGDFPWTGTGVGTFHAMVLEYGKRHGLGLLPPDNAQNWFRHQVAELGWIGAGGFFLWAVICGAFAVRRMFTGNPAAGVAAGALAGVLAASLLGVPTQEVSVLTTFWVMVAWLALAGELPPPSPSARGTGLLFGAVGLAAVLYAAGTAYIAVTQLRVPHRASSTGWDFSYGLSNLDGTATPAFRWTEEKAVVVFRPGGKYMRLSFRANHPDISERPVDVRVKLFGGTIIRERLRSHETVLRYVEVPPGTKYLMLTFLVSRTFDAPPPDPRRLGLAVDDWLFVDSPPAGAHVVKSSSAFPPPRNPYN